MINFDRMQRQFEESKHYSCGESQADRLANWNVWKDAWKAGLASQAQQPAKLVFDSESARQFLIESVLPKFSDRTFADYVRNELAGDFAYQLAVYLQSQAKQPNYGLHELAQIIMSDCGISTTNNDHLYDRILGRLIASSELQSQAQQTESQAIKALSEMVELWFRTRESGCLPLEVAHAQFVLKTLLPPAPEYQDTCTDGGKCGAGGYCITCPNMPAPEGGDK